MQKNKIKSYLFHSFVFVFKTPMLFIILISGFVLIFSAAYPLFSHASVEFEEAIEGASESDGDSVSGSVDNSLQADSADEDREHEIYINIASFTLKLISGGECEKKYKIRVGKLDAKTITGAGTVTKKFKKSYFRYSSGDQKGEIIRYSNIRSSFNGKIVKRIKIPYDKIKGLELEINGVVTGQIIHATTNPETLGHACSSGCIGLSIEDMLDLYDRVKTGAKVLIEYNPVEYHDGYFYFYNDIYNYKPDYAGLIEEIFNSYGISYTDDFIKQIIKKGKKEKKVDISQIYNEMKNKLAFEDVNLLKP
jgi:hypothetical protein